MNKLNNNTGPVNYKIGLFYYVFDNTSNNIRLYDSKEHRDAMLTGMVAVWQNLEVNIPFDNNIYLSVNFDVPETDENDILTLLNYNYCVISNEKSHQKYYYFIEDISQLTSTMVHLNLEIDTIQTYWYDLEFPLSIINNAHINRFKLKNEKDLYEFNNYPSSPLLNSDLTSLPKFLKTRIKNRVLFDSAVNSPLNTIFETQDINWLYVYLNPNVKGIFEKIALFRNNISQGTKMGYSVLVAPIYESHKDGNENYDLYLKKTDSDEEYLWTSEQLLLFLETDEYKAFVLNVKVSPNPPWDTAKLEPKTDYTISNYEITFNVHEDLNPNLSIYNLYGAVYIESVSKLGAFLNIFFQPKWGFYDIKLPFSFEFYPKQIKDKNNNLILEPALLSQPITAFHVTDYVGNSFDYDIQKLGKSEIRMLATEIFTPDLSKIYVRFIGDNNTVYKEDANYNFTGLVISNDTSIPYDIEQIKLFLSQNKNFFLQQQTNRVSSAVSTGASIAAGAVVGSAVLPGLGTAVGGLVGAVTGTILAINKYFTSTFQQDLTIDNMRASPSQINNAQGNGLLTITINDEFLYYYTDIYTPIDQDLFKSFWKSYLFGTPLNIIDNVNNYTKTRKVFNYLQADVISIQGKISNTVKTKIKTILNNGVIFWHQDTIDYSLANYELFLDMEE